MFSLPVDNNGKPIPLLPGERPRVVQRLTTVTTSAVNSSALHFLESRGIKEEIIIE